MQIGAEKKRFTVDEYYEMARVGILCREERVELIDGEIVRMSPIGERHAGCVRRAHRLFAAALGARAVISVQSPLLLNSYSEPEPDLVLLKPRPDDYMTKVRAEDALLVVEVSDTTLFYDRTRKLPRYAAANIPEVWIENLKTDELLVYRNPAGNQYAVFLTLHRNDNVSPLAFPDVVLSVADLLG